MYDLLCVTKSWEITFFLKGASFDWQVWSIKARLCLLLTCSWPRISRPWDLMGWYGARFSPLPLLTPSWKASQTPSRVVQVTQIWCHFPSLMRNGSFATFKKFKCRNYQTYNGNENVLQSKKNRVLFDFSCVFLVPYHLLESPLDCSPTLWEPARWLVQELRRRKVCPLPGRRWTWATCTRWGHTSLANSFSLLRTCSWSSVGTWAEIYPAACFLSDLW